MTWIFLAAAVGCLALAIYLLWRFSRIRRRLHIVGNDEQVARGVASGKRSGVVAGVSSVDDTTKVVTRGRRR